MFTEDELIPISTLQHMVFCSRQAGLILIERIWDENVLTVEGHDLHERAHTDEADMRNDVYTVRGLRIRSLRLGLVGMTDVVEFHHVNAQGKSNLASALPGRTGLWRPFIIEYKRGAPKIDHCDEVQICAQAICLEEMLLCQIPHAYLYYGETRRRESIDLNVELRSNVQSMFAEMHDLFKKGYTPNVKMTKACHACSLVELCLPKLSKGLSAADYVQKHINEMVV